jgi:hypothetical protein
MERPREPDRVRSIHIKANGGGPDAVIGEDKVNWPEVFAWRETKGGTQWYVLEHESSSNPLKAVTRSFEAFKKMSKVQGFSQNPKAETRDPKSRVSGFFRPSAFGFRP